MSLLNFYINHNNNKVYKIFQEIDVKFDSVIFIIIHIFVEIAYKNLRFLAQ